MTFFVLVTIISSLLYGTVTAEYSSNKTVQNFESIQKFRALIQPRIFPNHSYVHQLIQDDFYIRQWLTEGKFVISRAVQNFMEHLAWRHKHHIDTIHLENWDYFRAEYPQFINLSNDSCDVVSEVWTSDWNIRRAIFSGNGQKLVRWSIYQLEMTQRNISKARKKSKLKRTDCKAVDIIDMKNFNTWEHGCISCLNNIIGLVYIAEKHYPNIWTKVYMVNSGPLFRQAIGALGGNLNALSKGFMKVYTTREEWLPVLELETDKKQRSRRFGGHLIREADES